MIIELTLRERRALCALLGHTTGPETAGPAEVIFLLHDALWENDSRHILAIANEMRWAADTGGCRAWVMPQEWPKETP